jgi:hypothetical protein
MDDVRTRVVDIEGSVARLEDKIGGSHKRMEEMLKAILNSHGGSPSHGPKFMNHTMHGSEQNDPAKNIPIRTRTPLAPQSPVLQASLSDASNDGGVNRQEVGVVDVQVEEFLEGLLNYPAAQLGLPEGAKSANTIALSDKSDDVENDTVTQGIPKILTDGASAPNLGHVQATATEDEVSGMNR